MELRLELSLLNKLSMIGPRIMRAAMTTMAQNQDESILDQTLALFPGGKQHAAHLLSRQDQLTRPFIFVRLL